MDSAPQVRCHGGGGGRGNGGGGNGGGNGGGGNGGGNGAAGPPNLPGN